MHPFNLKAALAGAKVVTRNGEPVTELHWFKASHGLYGVHAGEIWSWSESGKFSYSHEESSLDLFMAEAPEQAVSVPDSEYIKLCAIQDAMVDVSYVYDAFKADIERGYETKDKKFAIDLLGEALRKFGEAAAAPNRSRRND